jgi:hypothetical protein
MSTRESFATFPKSNDYASGEQYKNAMREWKHRMVAQIKEQREELKSRYHWSPLLDSIFKEILGE